MKLKSNSNEKKKKKKMQKHFASLVLCKCQQEKEHKIRSNDKPIISWKKKYEKRKLQKNKTGD